MGIGLASKLRRAAGAAGAPWAIDTFSATGDTADISATDSSLRSIFLNPAGTKLFASGSTGLKAYEFDLSTPFDLTTVSTLQASFSINQFTEPRAISFSAAGDHMYAIFAAANDRVAHYTLSTGFDLTTAAYAGDNFSYGGVDNAPSVAWPKTDDGSKIFVLGLQNDRLRRHSTAAAWQASGMTDDSNFLSVGSEEGLALDMHFSPDGTFLFIAGANNIVYRYSMTTPWDPSTGSYDNVFLDASAQVTDVIHGVSLSTDGMKLYVLDRGTGIIYEYA